MDHRFALHSSIWVSVCVYAAAARTVNEPHESKQPTEKRRKGITEKITMISTRAYLHTYALKSHWAAYRFSIFFVFGLSAAATNRFPCLCLRIQYRPKSYLS